MKNPFTVGDRVAVYSTERDTGVVVKLLSDTQCMVTVAAVKNVHIAFEAVFHVKQLRRLVKRKPARQWWMNTYCLDLKSGTLSIGGDPFLSAEPVEGWTLVREVRPKK